MSKNNKNEDKWQVVDTKSKKLDKKQKKKENEEKARQQALAEQEEQRRKEELIRQRNKDVYEIAPGMESETLFSKFDKVLELEQQERREKKNEIRNQQQKKKTKNSDSSSAYYSSGNSGNGDSKSKKSRISLVDAINKLQVSTVKEWIAKHKAQYHDVPTSSKKNILQLQSLAGELEVFFKDISDVDDDDSVLTLLTNPTSYFENISAPSSLFKGTSEKEGVVKVLDAWIGSNFTDDKELDDAFGFLFHALNAGNASGVGIKILLQQVIRRSPLSTLKRVTEIKEKYMHETKQGYLLRPPYNQNILFVVGQLLLHSPNVALMFWVMVLSASVYATTLEQQLQMLLVAIAERATSSLSSTQSSSSNLVVPAVVESGNLLSGVQTWLQNALLPEKPIRPAIAKNLNNDLYNNILVAGILSKISSKNIDKYFEVLFPFTVVENNQFVLDAITHILSTSTQPEKSAKQWSELHNTHIPHSNNLFLHLTKNPSIFQKNKILGKALHDILHVLHHNNQALLSSLNKKKKGKATTKVAFTKEEIELCQTALEKLAALVGHHYHANHGNRTGSGQGVFGLFITLLFLSALFLIGSLILSKVLIDGWKIKDFQSLIEKVIEGRTKFDVQYGIVRPLENLFNLFSKNVMQLLK